MNRLLILGVALLVAGCGDNPNDLPGFSKSPPDEFAIAPKPPLVIPPEYGLRPPAPNAAGPVQVSVQDNARILLGLQRAKPSRPSALETLLLQKAGARDDDIAVRAELTEGAESRAYLDDAVIDKLAMGRAVIVNPAAEKLRIDGVLVAGGAATDSPTLIDDNRGFFSRLFGG